MKYKILFVDDEEFFLVALKSYFEPLGYEVVVAQSGATAIETIRKDPDGFTVAIVDYQMKGMDGVETVTALRKLNSELNLLVFSGKGNDPKILKSYLKVGPIEFLDKEGEDFKCLEDAVKRMCIKYDKTTRPAALENLPQELSLLFSEFPPIPGRSVSLANVLRKIKSLRSFENPILIAGETGTEKEDLALALCGGLSDGMLSLDCHEYREKLHELHYELFGREREGLSGNLVEKAGAVETHKGNLILHNLDDTDLEFQKKILTVIEEKQFRRIRGQEAVPCSRFRLIATISSKDRLLKELYQRLKSGLVEIPPLRERIEDLEPIVVSVCDAYYETSAIRRTVQKRVIRHLEAHSWPGNSAELRGYIEELLDHSLERQITPSDLDSKFFLEEEVQVFPPYEQFEKRIQSMEREYFEKALRRWSFNKDRTAREINLSPTGLRRKIVSLGLGSLKALGGRN